MFDLRTLSISPSGISTVTGRRRAFICGGIIFPELRHEVRLPGAVCVLAMLEDQNIYVLDMRQFNDYDFPLAQFFSSVYDKYKLDRYVALQNSEEDLETLRFWQEMAKRQYRKMDKIYPSVRKIQIKSDTQAFSPLISAGVSNRLHIRSPVLKQAIGQYDPERPFTEAPHEIQALCLALVFAAQRAWPAFESDRLERLNNMEDI